MMTKLKKILIALIFGSAVFAAPLLIPNTSFEKLDNVQKVSDRYEIDFGVESKIKIGGDGVNFKPHAKLGKWGDEVEINVWLETDKKIKPKQGDKKLKWIEKKREIHFYTIDDDKFEFEIILKEKPDSNVVELKIDSRELEFYHQPALDIEMADQDCWTDTCTPTDCCGSHRPIEVVGSYAVYHESKTGDYSKIGGKNYMAGKAFHIPYPYLVDSNGWKIRAENFEIDVENKLLAVTAPQYFIDNAVYPVRHAAGLTFGNTVAGETSSSGNDRVRGLYSSSGGSGETTKITAYLGGANYGATRCTLYSNTTTRLGESSEASSTSTSAWVDFPYVQSITDQSYYIVMFVDNKTHWYDAASPSAICYATANYPSWPGTLSTTTSSKYSIYATYTDDSAERRIIKIE